MSCCCCCCCAEFRLLLVYLCIYSTLYEVFAYIVDVGPARSARSRHVSVTGSAQAGDHRVSREEWAAAVGEVRHIGRTWAPFVRLQRAAVADFDAMDANGGGHVDFSEFCEWVEAAEKLEGTAAGRELGVNEPVDAPYNGELTRPWRIKPGTDLSMSSLAAVERHKARLQAGRARRSGT